MMTEVSMVIYNYYHNEVTEDEDDDRNDNFYVISFSLQNVLDYEGDVEADMCMTFQVVMHHCHYHQDHHNHHYNQPSS